MPTNSLILLTDPAAIRFGGRIAFAFSVDPREKGLVGLTVICSQNGVVVYGAGGFPPQSEFTLGPTGLWSGGEAKGSALLYQFNAHNPSKLHVLSQVDFHVNA